MYQMATTSQGSIQGQSKKLPSRIRSLEVVPHSGYVNDRSKKNLHMTGAPKYPVKKTVKNFKQFSAGRRDKAFSKNENRIANNGGTKRYNEQNYRYDGNEPLPLENLLNFHYPTGRTTASTDWRRNPHSNRRRSCFNKEEYLQARCNFVVTSSPDEIKTDDPDKLVDWKQIQLVYLLSHDPPNCPICLYSPIAAKITRCGHIFCWSCILHYLHLGEKTWRKCPICHEAVHQKDLKSVKSYAQKKYSRFDTISLKLMKRAKDSIFATQVSGEEAHNAGISSWTGNSCNFPKIMYATPNQVVELILLKEKEELLAQLSTDIADENGEEVFIQMALKALESDIANLKVTAFSDDENASQDQSDLKAAFGYMNLSNIDDCNSQVSDAEREDLFLEESDADINMSKCDKKSADYFESSDFSHGSDKSACHIDSYYFYQAEDGQNIFLHSLNARCLIEEYGSLEISPEKIVGQIIDFDIFTMTKELRRRFRYLNHLPLSSEFMICELMLKPPILSQNTIHNFADEFKKRKAMRVRKMKIQQRSDRQAIAVENDKFGSPVYVDGDIPEIDLSDMVNFPSSLSPEKHNSDVKNETFETENCTGLSFAQMLKTESSSPQKMHASFPVKNTLSPTNVADNSILGYETASHLASLGRAEEEDSDGPDIMAPDFKQTFSAAMFSAPAEKEEIFINSKRKGAKKKREKGTLLFATGGQRKY